MEPKPRPTAPSRRLPHLALLTLIAAASAGCLLLRSRRPITTDYLAADAGADAAPVAADAVSVIERPDQLPEGMTWRTDIAGPPGRRLAIEAGFPTADDPHRLLGAVAAKEGDVRGRDKLLAAARAEAGRHGANLIFVLDDRHDVVTALALRVSAATSTETFPTATALLGQRPEKLGAYTPDGQPVAIDLASPEAITLQARRGDCLAVHVALESDARLGGGLAGLSVERTDARGVGAVNALARHVDRRERAIAGAAGCQLVDGKVELRLGPGRSLGRGRALVQVFRKRIGEDEVAKLAAKEEAGFAAARASSRARDREVCGQCLPLLVTCATPDQPGSCREYASCLSRKYVKVDQCGR